VQAPTRTRFRKRTRPSPPAWESHSSAFAQQTFGNAISRIRRDAGTRQILLHESANWRRDLTFERSCRSADEHRNIAALGQLREQQRERTPPPFTARSANSVIWQIRITFERDECASCSLFFASAAMKSRRSLYAIRNVALAHGF